MNKKLAAVQMECITGNIDKNTKTIIGFLEKMKKEEHEILLAVFPEMALYGYESLEKIHLICDQNIINEYLEKIATVCKKLQVDAVVGGPYFSYKGLENALYFADSKGSIQHIYSKRYLIKQERRVFVPGDSYNTCKTEYGKIGFLICWDSAFPETARAYAKAGVDMLIISAAWENPYGRQWELAVCGRSFDNDLPVIASNRIGGSETVSFAGQSMITDCMGNILIQETKGLESYITMNLQELLSKDKRYDFGSQIEELKEEG